MVASNALSTPPTDARPPWFVDLNVPPEAEFASGLALSSDGGTLLYGGPRSIWLRRAGSTTPVPIAGTDGGCCPALSPNGQQVAFIRGRNLHVVPVEGGDSRELATGFQSGDDIAWTTDGYIVGAAAGRAIGAGALIRVRATGGVVEAYTRVDTLAGEALHWSPRALPGGRGVVFTILPLDRNDSLGLRIAVVGPDGGPHTVLMAGRVATYARPGYLIVALRDGEVVAVPFDRSARRLTGDPIPLFSVPRAAGTFTWKGYTAVAPTGTLVYVGGVEPMGEFVWVDRSGAATPAGFDARFTTGHASIAAGGDVIAFDATRDLDRPVIEVRDLRRQTSSRIELADGNVHDVSFAPDGQSLIFRVVAPGRQGVFTTTLGRLGELTELLADPNAFVPSISRDHRTLYYVRNARGNLEFVAHPLGQPGSPAQVLAAGGISVDWQPRLSPDGRWLAFVDVSASGHQLFVRSTDPGRTERWLVAPATGTPIQWAPSGRELFFYAHDSVMVAEVSTSPTFTVGRVRSLFPRRFGEFQVGADGRFLAARAVRGTSSIRLSLIDDWRSLLTERSR
jgi:serine/threonine-protein kinase